MDRKFFLALALAMVVAVAYQSIFVVPKRLKDAEHAKSLQVLVNKEDNEKEVIKTALLPAIEKKTTNIIKEAKISTLTTTELNIDFSNMGGSLHNVGFMGKEKAFPVENILTVKGFELIPFNILSKTDTAITYVYSDSEWKIVKHYSIYDKNSIKASIEVSKLKPTSRLEDIQIRAMNINSESIDVNDNRNTMLDELSILENKKKVFRKGNAFKFNAKDNKSNAVEVEWVTFRDHYHAFIVKPEFETKGYENEMVSEKQLIVNIKPKNQILPGESATYEFLVVVGNQDMNWLKTYNKGIEKIVAFSSFWPIEIFAKAVYHTIPVLHKICHSWGFSIILISLLIYGITYPLTMKSMSSMRKMQLVQPKVAALQAKYKGDPQKLNGEMVALYKKEGVNPLGGCLPFLLQMPVFMALYQILWRAYYFQGQSFLWIKDLALPDRLFILPFSLPFLGNEFNILPIVMAGVMFLQQSVSSKNMVVTDEQQAMQQKMMKYIFPFFIGFIFYHFASGLSLYFTVFYALSTWTQWKISHTGTTAVVKVKE